MTPSLGHLYYMDECRTLALRSPDPSTKVGAVVVDASGIDIVGRGWNSFPPSSAVSPAVYSLKQEKYDRIIHSEMRALLQAGRQARGGTLYTTLVPCKECAKHIAEAGIQRVYYPTECLASDWAQRESANIEVTHYIFDECGVGVEILYGTQR